MGGATSPVAEARVEAARGGLMILAGGLGVSLAGLVYWMVMPRLAGMDAVNAASAAVSASGVAVSLVSSGLQLAVLREASSSREGFAAGLLAGAAFSMLSLALAYMLASRLSLPGFLAALAAVIAAITVLSGAAAQGVVGLGMFHGYAIAQALGAAAKLAVGWLLATAGLGAVAILAGYMSHPLAVLAVSLYLALPLLRCVDLGGARRYLPRLAALALSNYPQALSQQLPLMLSVYLYSLLGEGLRGTGALYLSLMIAVALTMLPASLATAALPVGERRRAEGLIAEQLQLGLALMAPLAAGAAAAPYALLYILKPQLAMEGWEALAVLAAATPTLAVFGGAVLEYNRSRARARLALLGGARLAALIALLPPLTRSYGILGAALAYIFSTAAAAPLALRPFPQLAGKLLALQASTLAPAAYTLLTGPSRSILEAAMRASLAAAGAAAAALASKATTPMQIAELARMLLRRPARQAR